MAYLWIALGSALGGMLRYWLGAVVSVKLGAAYLGTVFVNVSGSLAMGFVAAQAPAPVTRQLVMIGLLGGYTTFSTFSWQTLELAREGRWPAVMANIALSVGLSLLGVWLGYWCGTVLRTK